MISDDIRSSYRERGTLLKAKSWPVLHDKLETVRDRAFSYYYLLIASCMWALVWYQNR